MELFGVEKPIVGMVHLNPLLGSPRYDGSSVNRISELAVQDARHLENGGVDGLMVENFGDMPYMKMEVGSEVVSAMAVIVADVVDAVKIPVGVNVLRNDFKATLAIAHVAGGKFLRTNVFVDGSVTDQGLIEASAPELLRYRRYLGADVKIFADIQGKHGVPLSPRPVEQSAMDAAYRGLADALIVSGLRTGTEPELEDLLKVKKAVPDKPLFVGSGVDMENAAKFLKHVDGAIVGTSLKFDGVVANPVDEKRVKALMTAVKELRR